MDFIGASFILFLFFSFFAFIVYKGVKNEKNIMPDADMSSPKLLELNVQHEKEIPDGVACSYCKGNKISARYPITGVGVLIIVIGLFFMPFTIVGVTIGLILIIAGANTREKKYYCNDCKREF